MAADLGQEIALLSREPRWRERLPRPRTSERATSGAIVPALGQAVRLFPARRSVIWLVRRVGSLPSWRPTLSATPGSSSGTRPARWPRSGSCGDHLQGKLDLPLEFGGERHLKQHRPVCAGLPGAAAARGRARHLTPAPVAVPQVDGARRGRRPAGARPRRRRGLVTAAGRAGGRGAAVDRRAAVRQLWRGRGDGPVGGRDHRGGGDHLREEARLALSVGQADVRSRVRRRRLVVRRPVWDGHDGWSAWTARAWM